MGEVEELDLAEESSRHCLESESPRIGITAEFKAGDGKKGKGKKGKHKDTHSPTLNA